jgi:hypothetical protein
MGNLKTLAACFLISACAMSFTVTATGGALVQKLYGISRPYVVEPFGCHDEVSLQFADCDLFDLQLVGRECGADLYQLSNTSRGRSQHDS